MPFLLLLLLLHLWLLIGLVLPLGHYSEGLRGWIGVQVERRTSARRTGDHFVYYVVVLAASDYLEGVRALALSLELAIVIVAVLEEIETEGILVHVRLVLQH